MIVYEILQYLLIAVVGLPLGYQLLLSLMALRGKKLQNFYAVRNRRFAIIIPAHNEEEVIAKTLYSLHGLVYPKNLYNLIVVADHCTDDTAKIARNLGASVLERVSDNEFNRGEAVEWAIDQVLIADKYDAIVIFDADNLVSGNYLEVMNYYIDQGSTVIQCSNLILPEPGMWSSEVTKIKWLLYNFANPLGKKNMGFDVELQGNGMCISTNIIRENPRRLVKSDVEYGLKLILNDVSIDFAPEASVWTQIPASSESVKSQNRWWQIGRYPVVRKYAPRLLTASIKKRSLRYIDVLMNLITPPLVITLVLIITMCIVNAVLWSFGWISGQFVGMWGILMGWVVLHVLSGLYAAGADSEVYKSLIYAPMYTVWKIKLYFTALNSRNGKQEIPKPRETNAVVKQSVDTNYE